MHRIRPIHAKVTVVTALVSAGVCGAIATGVAAGGSPPLKPCPPVHGVKWAAPGSSLKGSVYTVQATAAFGCAKADKLVPGLAKQIVKRLPTGVLVAPKPPPGLVCYVTPDTAKRAYIGRCAKKTPTPSPFSFTWSPGRG